MKNILVLNSGSTSLKYKIFNENLKLLQEGSFKEIGKKIKNHEQAFLMLLAEIKPINVDIIAHRVVHGGGKFENRTEINSKALKEIEKFSELAPLHNPPAIKIIKLCIKKFPKNKNIAFFDTAFFKDLPKVAYTYGIPAELALKFNIRRFGFHGLSHNYVALIASQKLKKPLHKLNLITVHLGGGSSIAAIKNGVAIDTSMGFTPTEGLLMQTRIGDFDCGALLYLMKKEKLSIVSAEELINKKSGYRGIFGSKINFKEIEKKALKGNVRAKLARELFIYRIIKYIGSYYFVLKKIDAIAFTGGIGEADKKIVNNIKKSLPIKTKVFQIKTDEEKFMAKQLSKF